MRVFLSYSSADRERVEPVYFSFARGDVRNLTGPAAGTAKVIRGGGWTDPAPRLRSTRRMHARPEHRGDDVGFRCVRELRP